MTIVIVIVKMQWNVRFLDMSCDTVKYLKSKECIVFEYIYIYLQMTMDKIVRICLNCNMEGNGNTLK